MSASYIFDVEGTLIDCVPDILHCWSETLVSFRIAVPSADFPVLSPDFAVSSVISRPAPLL